MLTAEQRLAAFFTAIQPHMKAHEVSAAMISVTGYDKNNDTGFMCMTRVGTVGVMPNTEMLQHLIKMHDDMHEVLEAMADRIEGKLPAHRPTELN